MKSLSDRVTEMGMEATDPKGWRFERFQDSIFPWWQFELKGHLVSWEEFRMLCPTGACFACDTNTV